MTAAQAPDIETLAKVLAEHSGIAQIDYDPARRICCLCDSDTQRFASWDDFRAHVAAAVLAAGFMRPEDVAEAQARALEEAADALDDHTDCDCENGDHLIRMAGSGWIRDRARLLSEHARTATEADVAEAQARAWDECAKEACDLGWMHEHGEQDILERNPYRAAALRPVDAPEGGASDE